MYRTKPVIEIEDGQDQQLHNTHHTRRATTGCTSTYIMHIFIVNTALAPNGNVHVDFPVVQSIHGLLLSLSLTAVVVSRGSTSPAVTVCPP